MMNLLLHFFSLDIRVTKRQLLIVLAVLISHVVGYIHMCPNLCSCHLDDKGRKITRCDQGWMTNGLPVAYIDHDVNILEVSAPPSKPNRITIGPIFQNFKSIEEVHIVQSNIPAIGKHTFWGVSTLRVLNLSRNNISTIIDQNFKGLTNLSRLYLVENQIQSMHSGVFVFLPELQVLALSRNQITQLAPRVFLKLSKLAHLDLSYNPIHELEPDVFKDIQILKEFRCRKCGIQNIKNQLFRTLIELEYLDLGENELTYLNDDWLVNLKYINSLYMDGNKLKKISENTLKFNKYLEVINFSENHLLEMTDHVFDNLTSVTTLDISYNKLESLDPNIFSGLSHSLHNLRLGGNYITISNLKQILCNLPHLKILSLSDMRYTELPSEIFIRNTELQFLNLSGNNMMHYNVYIQSPLKNLRDLDISRNNLKGLDDKTCYKFENLRRVFYHDNPWLCDLCHITPLLKRVNKSSNTIPAANDLICFKPNKLKGRNLKTLNFEILDWCEGSELEITETSLILLSSRSQIGLISAITSIIALFSLIGITIYITNSKYRAYYYTNEDKRAQDRESVLENRIVGNFIDKKCENRRIMIATIDELSIK